MWQGFGERWEAAHIVARVWCLCGVDVGTCWTLHLSACLLAEIVAMRKAYLWLALACLAVDYSLCTASSPELQFKSGGAQRPGTAVMG